MYITTKVLFSGMTFGNRSRSNELQCAIFNVSTDICKHRYLRLNHLSTDPILNLILYHGRSYVEKRFHKVHISSFKIH